MLTAERQWVLCLTRQEWRNLVTLGWLRIAVQRICRVRGEDDPAALRVFLAMPNVNLEDSGDHVVVTLVSHWRELAEVHPLARKGGILNLPLQAVRAFHPVHEKDRELLSLDASRGGVAVAAAALEQAWQQWVIHEGVRLAERAGARLVAALGLGEPRARLDGVSWSDMARILIRPADSVSRHPSPTMMLLSGLDRLLHAARGHSVDTAILLASVRAWVEFYSGQSIKQTDVALGESVAAALEQIESTDGEVECLGPPKAAFLLDRMCCLAPAAFDSERTPRAVASLLQLALRAKAASLNPERLIVDIRAVQEDGGLEPARLVAFSIGAILGLQKVFGLELQLRPDDFLVGATRSA